MEHSNPTLTKILILDTGKFEQWKFEIQQYLQNEHYALWEVIEFGDSYEAPKNDATTGSASEGSAKKKGRTVVVTSEDMQKRRNDIKARTTLLLALPDEHQLRFSKYKTAQELWDAILKTFGGNEATKKTKKNLLKQQEVNTASIPTTSTQVSPASANVAATSISLDTACAYIASQSNGSQIKYEDINQIDEDYIEKIDIKECRAPRSQDRDRRENFKQGSKVDEQAAKALMAIDGVGWDWSYMENKEDNHALVADEEAPTEFALMAKSSSDNEVEARLVEFKNQEIKFCEKIRGLEFKVESKTNRIENITNELEMLKKDKEGLNSKLTDDTITDYTRPLPSIESNPNDLQNNSSSVSKNGESTGSILSKPAIKFVKAADSPTVIKTNKDETIRKPSVRYAKMYKKTSKSSNVRGNQRNWNNLKSQQLGKNFLMKNKACFNCGDFDHLSYNYGKWVDQGKTWAKNNYTHKSRSPRIVFHKFDRTSTRTTRPNMNAVRPKKTSFYKPAHLYVIRPFQRNSAVRTQSRVPRVPTVNRKFPTVNKKFLTGNLKVSTADMGNKGKAVKASACWIWKPRQNSTDKGPNSNSVSVIFKKYQYIDTLGRLNGCSRHMTGNISYLSDYEPYDGGYVSFGQGGCKITGKGTIKIECIVLG
nr:ribonuclease H-like domain-containing protein [Tanacetum cinerariifolium]